MIHAEKTDSRFKSVCSACTQAIHGPRHARTWLASLFNLTGHNMRSRHQLKLPVRSIRNCQAYIAFFPCCYIYIYTSIRKYVRA